MKKALLIIGIVLLVIGALALLIGWFFGYASMHTMDGPAGLYAKQRRMMLIFILSGLVVVVGGIVCLICRAKV